MGLERGLFPDVWQAFAADPLQPFATPYWTEHFTREDLEALAAEGYRRFYFQPRRLMQTLCRLATPRRLPGLLRAGWRLLRA